MQFVAALTETAAEAPMSKPAQEVAVAEPEPATEFNTEPDSVLSEGGLNAKKDIQGNQKSMSTNYGAEYQERYRRAPRRRSRRGNGRK